MSPRDRINEALTCIRTANAITLHVQEHALTLKPADVAEAHQTIRIELSTAAAHLAFAEEAQARPLTVDPFTVLEGGRT